MQIDVNQRSERGTTQQSQQAMRRMEQVSHLPSRGVGRINPDAFLWTAGASLILSAGLRFFGRREDAIFVGEWVPTFLLLGIYNRVHKLSEQQGY